MIFSRHCRERFDAVTDPDGLELGAGRQQIGVVLAVAHDRHMGRKGIRDHQQVQLFQRLFHLHAAGLAVAGMALEDDRPDIVLLREVLLYPPARRRSSARRGCRAYTCV